MKKIAFFLLSLLVGFGIFFGVVKWAGWQEVKEYLLGFSGPKGITILVLTILIWLVGFWKWQFVLKSQGYNFSLLSLGEIFFASNALAYLLTPTAVFGGEAFRVYAARKKFSLPWEKNIAAVAIEKLLSSSILLMFLIFGAVSFLFLARPPLREFGIIAATVIGLLAVGLGIFYFRSYKKESILKWLLSFFGLKNKKNNHTVEKIEEEIFHFFEFKKILMWKGLGIAFLKYFLILARCWILVLFLKGGVNVFVSLAIFFFLYLSYLLPLPAGLGSLEAAQAFAFSSLGMGTTSGISFSFILRGAEVVVALFGVVLLIKLGIKFFTDEIRKLIGLISRFTSK